MVVVTRSITANMTAEQGALDHVLGNVLGYPDDHQVRLAPRTFLLWGFGVNDVNALSPCLKVMTLHFLTSFQTQQMPLNKLKHVLSMSMQDI